MQITAARLMLAGCCGRGGYQFDLLIGITKYGKHKSDDTRRGRICVYGIEPLRKRRDRENITAGRSKLKVSSRILMFPLLYGMAAMLGRSESQSTGLPALPYGYCSANYAYPSGKDEMKNIFQDGCIVEKELEGGIRYRGSPWRTNGAQ